MEIQYSQLKINHLKDTSSTKAAGGGIYSGVLLKDVKVPVKVRRTLSSVGTSSSNNENQPEHLPWFPCGSGQSVVGHVLSRVGHEGLPLGIEDGCQGGWGCDLVRPLVCWLVHSLLSWQRSSLWFSRAMWCLHQRQVCPLIFFSRDSPSLGGVFFWF
jgi:hypothetical protein